MFSEKWVAFESFCMLSFMLGLNYLSIYSKVKPIIPLYEDFLVDMYDYLYTLLYIILGPLCFRLIWKSFYWSNIFGWLCVLAYTSLKYLNIEETITEPIGRVCLVVASSLVLPGTGVLAYKYFKPKQYIFVLNFSAVSHLVGIVFGQVLNYYLDEEILLLAQIVFCFFALVFFAFGSKPDHCRGFQTYGFCEAIKIMFEDKDRGILFMTISAQIGIIYCTTTEFYNLYFLLYKGNVQIVYIYLASFGILSIIGSIINWYLIKKLKLFGVLVRLYLGIPFLILFLLNFIFKGQVFFTIMCLIVGLTALPCISYMQIILFNWQIKVSQPFSINLSIYFSSFFTVLFLLISRTLYSYDIRSSWGYNIIQLFIVTCFLSVYEFAFDNTALIKSS